ncbi:MAG: acetyl-CoA carboxylase biotin carboxylase subunit [Bacteroidales bacterium]|jgi:acetyl-CoA carboxylase, biotin carboxylase subunit|nr:acetyl-CoA carboxylase biotin carboxylase subunit [Lentimicrobiaceae bacterium]MDG1135810.1 acetyl-CoA carboxylase biotin carboxylase subunit [Bacteroidales bacterium]MDG1902250.1 acetyl-CoA carboxylase biotin carboxylase subunit [Bacteroidales bacterium]MDG2080212.1 acetyl-CoA carboxylase biotin carboxylase subunit [Bacteroidales bacterium]|tara:strand:- start:10747 stop:12255 length:1509 start_codon:yes stop_codon:yes gene_type:complete
MIKKILVANRGEIAIRVMRSCREMGIDSVAVYSAADRASMHVRYADEAYLIGPAPSNESYLVIDNIIAAAKESGADAIHPGYGFLSENAEFSDRCKKEGLIFIGPSSFAINTMGDKITARKKMQSASVPVVPGTTEPITDLNEAVEVIKGIGLPVMIKASAGGGGKGMRLVTKEKDIISSVKSAKSEAKAAFSNDAVYIEKYIDSPHHIEFQIVADNHGNCVHLFERECSVQRRHQKVVEETPSPIMTDKVRAEMGKHAVAAAMAVNYSGAGTIEFIVDDNLNYYFLEMNTRLQVEHPITERVVGVDLVKTQINIANNKTLDFKQEDLKQTGHAIEVRIYAEDPDNNFMPNPGRIEHMTEPLGLGVRHDGYVYSGYEIPIYYDPMISKLIVWAQTREEAIDRLRRALHEYKITGIKTTIPFLSRILDVPDFINGRYNTHFVQDNEKLLRPNKKSSKRLKEMVAIASFMNHLENIESIKNNKHCSPVDGKWKAFGRKRNVTRL